MGELLWLMLSVSLLASYTAWSLLTLRILDRVKNPYLYLLFPVSVLSTATVLGALHAKQPLLAFPVPLALALCTLAPRIGRKIILVPLPLVIALLLTLWQLGGGP